jgi:O-antigen/teichoic acid export membrane protein
MLILGPDLRVADSNSDRRACGAALVIGCVALVALAPLLWWHRLRGFGLLGLGMPFLLWQDATRYVFFARRVPAFALASDALWLLLEGAGAVAVLHERWGSLDVWIAVWVVSAAITATVTAQAASLWPMLRGLRSWAARVGRTSSQLLGDFLFTTGGQQVTVFLLPVVGGLSVLGALKAAQVATGPLNVSMTAVGVLAIPAIAALTAEQKLGAARRRAFHVAAFGCTLGLVFAGAAAVVPERWGHILFGASWLKAPYLIEFVALQVAFVGLIQGAVVLLRGTRNTRRGLLVRIIVTPLNVSAPLVGAALGGTRGLGYALVLATLVAAAVWWVAALRATRSSRTSATVGTPAGLASVQAQPGGTVASS